MRYNRAVAYFEAVTDIVDKFTPYHFTPYHFFVMYYVYLLKSKKYPDKIYIGSTNSVIRRLKDHNDGKVNYTSRYIPWTLIYYEAYLEEKLARVREHRLKNNGNSMIELKKRINFKKW